MSDYLWDKSGEPEEDVKQLEQLLGALRYEPRPLQLPEDFSAHAARNSFRPQQRPFQWQRLAIAASLLLTLLAGAWLIMSQHNKEVRREAAEQKNVAPAKVAAPPAQAADVSRANEELAEEFSSAPAQPAISKRVNYPRPPRVFNRARANATRRAPQALTTEPQEQVATMTEQQREATQQLLLALRIASAKFNDARREMQEASAGHKPETR